MNDEELIEDFCKHFCIVCKKRIAVFCGTPVLRIGGCCSGVEHKKKKTFYCRAVHAHIWCYDDWKESLQSKQKKLKKIEWKTKWGFEEIKKIVENEQKRIHRVRTDDAE